MLHTYIIKIIKENTVSTSIKIYRHRLFYIRFRGGSQYGRGDRSTKKLEQLTLHNRVTSIDKTSDTIIGIEASLNALVLADYNFKDYEIIY